MKKKIVVIIGIISVLFFLFIMGLNIIKKDNTDVPNAQNGIPADILEKIQNNESITIEIAVPDGAEEFAEAEVGQLFWDPLNTLTSNYGTLRSPIENALGITMSSTSFNKTGMIYESNTGEAIQNNTLKGALENDKFREAIDKDDIISVFSDAAANTFADLEADEEMTNFYMAINEYFALLPSTENGYANPQGVLTRAQFMTMVFRAETPVDRYWFNGEDEFTAEVGDSIYNIYAKNLDSFGYLSTADKSLNNQTYNGNISRAEAIYMLMNKYYSDELKSVDTSKVALDDAKDGGDIAKEQGFTGDYGKSYEMVYSINNPDAGVPTDIYKALVLAESKGLIDSETRFDEAITLEESVELLVNIYKELPSATTTESESNLNEWGYSDKIIPAGSQVEKLEDGRLRVTLENGISYQIGTDGRVKMTIAQMQEADKIDVNWCDAIDCDADGMTYDEYKEKQANGTLTWQDMQKLSMEEMSLEEYNKRAEDGFIWGTEKKHEDGSTYILLDDGTEVNYDETLPNGVIYMGNASDRFGI